MEFGIDSAGHKGETFPGSNVSPEPLRLENQLRLLALIQSASKNLSGVEKEALLLNLCNLLQ